MRVITIFFIGLALGFGLGFVAGVSRGVGPAPHDHSSMPINETEHEH